MGLGDNVNFLVAYTRELFKKFLDSTVLESNVRRYKTNNPDADAVLASDISSFIGENILRELDLAKRIQYAAHQVEDCRYEVVYKDSIKQVTPTSCNCRFFNSMRLPCRHIFFLRAHLHMVVFQASLIPDMHLLGRTTAASSICGTITSTVADVRPVCVSTQEASYRRASKLCQEISVYLSILGENEFLDKYQYLSNLLHSWRDDVHGSSVDVDTVTDADGTLYLVPQSVVPSVSTSSLSIVVCGPSASEVPQVSATLPSDVSEDTLSVTDMVCGPSVVATLPSEVSTDASAPMSPVAAVDTPSSPSFVNVRLQRCKVKGRPKKQVFTRKRKCKVPKCFASLSLAHKKHLILKSVVRDDCFIDETMLIDQSMLRQQYADTVLDSIVHLEIVADNFSSNGAFNYFCSSVENMRRMPVFSCGSCCVADDGEEKMIQCGHCVYWCHFSCVGYKSAMNVKNWFCSKCWSTL